MDEDTNYRWRVLLLLFLAIPVTCCVPLMVLAAGSLGFASSSGWLPEEAKETIAENLGVSKRLSFELTSELSSTVGTVGIDSEMLATDIAAVKWISDTYGQQIDVGMLLSIMKNESGNGTSTGGTACSLTEMEPVNLDAPTQRAAAQRWMKRIQEYDARAKNPLAEKVIWPNYDGFWGGASCEIGAHQSIPETWDKVCNILMKHPDPEIASCDATSNKVSTFGAAVWLYLIGYRAGLTDEGKMTTLYGWNRLESWRRTLIDDSVGFNKTLEDLGIENFSASIVEVPVVSGDTQRSDFVWWLVQLSNEYGLLPESYGDMHIPISQTWSISGTLVASSIGPGVNWNWTLLNAAEPYLGINHLGIDYKCAKGDPVYADGDGYISDPLNPAYKYDPDGWGTALWIDHKNDLWSLYGHLDGVAVQYGQKVEKGQLIGFCGNSGNVIPGPGNDGTHLHYGIRTYDPDAPHLWWEGWVDPNQYMGGKVSGPVKQNK